MPAQRRTIVLLLGLTVLLFACGPRSGLSSGKATGIRATVGISLTVIPTLSPIMSAIPTPPATASPTPAYPSPASAPVIGAGPSRFTGSFMVDGRPTWLGFLRLTQTGTAVTGYLLVVQPGNQGATAGQTVSVQGNTDGDAITLIASSLFNLANLTLSGAMQRNGQLMLTAPTSSGYVETLPFVPASQNAFNAAVAAWQQALGSAYASELQAQADATAQAERQNAVAIANRTLSNALRALASDSGQLKRDTDFTSVLKAYGNDWTKMQADWQKEQRDAGKRPFDCYQLSVVQYDSSVVDYDLSLIQYDDSSPSYVRTTVTGEAAQVNRDIAAVDNASSALQSAAAANATGVPAPEFRPADVSAAIGSVQGEITSATDALQQAQAQAAGFDKEAPQLDSTAKQFANSRKC